MKQIIDCICEYIPEPVKLSSGEESISQIVPIRIRMNLEDGYERGIFEVAKYRLIEFGNHQNSYVWKYEAMIHPEKIMDRRIRVFLFYYALDGTWELSTDKEE